MCEGFLLTVGLGLEGVGEGLGVGGVGDGCSRVQTHT